jgi:hypothetical protein
VKGISRLAPIRKSSNGQSEPKAIRAHRVCVGAKMRATVSGETPNKGGQKPMMKTFRLLCAVLTVKDAVATMRKQMNRYHARARVVR